MRQSGRLPTRRKYTLSLSGLYGLASLVCVLLFWQYWSGSATHFLVIVLPITVAVAMGIATLLRAFSLELGHEYVEAWEAVAESDEGDTA